MDTATSPPSPDAATAQVMRELEDTVASSAYVRRAPGATTASAWGVRSTCAANSVGTVVIVSGWSRCSTSRTVQALAYGVRTSWVHGIRHVDLLA